MRLSNMILITVLIVIWLMLYTIKDFQTINISHPFMAFVLGALVCILFNEVEEIEK